MTLEELIKRAHYSTTYLIAQTHTAKTQIFLVQKF